METDVLIHIGGHKKISPNQILLLKADVNYTFVYLEDGSQFLSSTNIGLLEKRLEGYQFFRTHRSTIINLEHFSNIEVMRKFRGLSIIRMKDDTKIPLSRRKTIEFLKLIN